MNVAPRLGLTQEIGLAGRGIVRLARFDPRWWEAFDFSTTGFVRSFLARLLGLPFYLFFAAVIDRALSHGQIGTWAALWPETAAFLIDLVVYPLLIALIARPLKIAAGYAAFIIVTNWTSLFLNVVLALVSVLATAGEGGLAVFGLFWFVLAGLAIFLTWRAARETLSHELAPVVLVVVLSVASGALIDQLVAWLSGHP